MNREATKSIIASHLILEEVMLINVYPGLLWWYRCQTEEDKKS